MRILLSLAVLWVAPPPVAQVDESVPAIVWAVRLPALVTEARQSGVAEVAIRALLDEFRLRGLPADEAALVLKEEVEALHSAKSMDNFGAFVHRQLEAGLRGRALAQAIQAEHEALGIGRSRGKGQGKDTLKPHGGTP